VTCDINKLSLEHSVTGGHCNTKGRLLFSFRAILVDSNPAGDKIALMMHRDLIAPAQQALAKFIVFSKATLSQDTNLRVLGLSGAAANEALGKHFSIPGPESGAASHSDKGCVVR